MLAGKARWVAPLVSRKVRLITRAAVPTEPASDAAESAGAPEQSRAESRVVDGSAAGALLSDATVETVTKGDGRYVIYYSWPDDV